jgi:hypothetical protein
MPYNFLTLTHCTITLILLLTTYQKRKHYPNHSTQTKWCAYIVGDFGVHPEDEHIYAGMIESEQRHVRVANAMARAMDEVCKPNIIILAGDLVYPSGVLNEQDRRKIDYVFARFPNELKTKDISWLATVGNHDCTSDALAALKYPLLSPLQHGTYGFHDYDDIGLRIVFLDTCIFVCARPMNNNPKQQQQQEQNFRCEEGLQKYMSMQQEWNQQMEWFEQLLQNTNRNQFPKLFIVGHWPIFSFRGNGPTRELFMDLLPLLQRYQVTAYFSGHDHALQYITQDNNVQHPILFLGSGAGGYNLHVKLKPEAEREVNKQGFAQERFVSDDDGGFLIVRNVIEQQPHYHTKWIVDFIHATNGTVYSIGI